MKALPLFGGLASVLACILAWEVLFVPDEASDIQVPRPDLPPTRVAAELDTDILSDIAATVLERPLFSPDRRFAAPEPRTLGETEDVPRLAGVIIGPGGGRAIFDDGSGHLRIAASGDSLGRFKVGAIAPGQVSMISPEGERVLRPRFSGLTGPLTVAAGPGNGPAR
jgi:hypothetical protein